MRLTVQAPATVANLGPGFDCLALAVDVVSTFTADTDRPPAVEVEGQGADELPRDATNLVFRTIAYLAREAGGNLPPFALAIDNRIPLQRGLGSSASAVVAGLLLGDRMLGSNLSDDDLLAVAVDIEGHADNVSACLRGGLALAYLSQQGWRAHRLTPSPELRPVLMIPNAERVATDEARRVLPREVPLADAVFNLSRAALAVVALTEAPELLPTALEDRLHQARRLPLAPSSRALFSDLRDAGLPVCVAGSGPTLLAFESPGNQVWDLGPGWTLLRPGLRFEGATLEQAPAPAS